MIKTKDLWPQWQDRDQSRDSEVWGRTLEFPPGEATLVVAPSGRGKTSFIRFLTGDSVDFTGSLSWEGRDARQLLPNDWARLRQKTFSLVPQTLNLLDDLGVEENILLRTRIQGLDDPDWRSQARDLGLLEAVLEGKTPVRRLSQGEKQRVALLRSLQGPFNYLILDEPFSHLQPSLARTAWNLIQKECKIRGAGILLTSLDRLADWTGRELQL